MRSLALSSLVLAVVLFAPVAAAGEPCEPPGELARLAQGTFVGTPTRVVPGPDSSLVSFAVDEVFTGPIPQGGTVEVRVHAPDWDGASPVGVLVTRVDAGWVADGCGLMPPDLLRSVAPTRVSPESLGGNERETLKEPPLWIFFSIFGGGIAAALLVQRLRNGD